MRVLIATANLEIIQNWTPKKLKTLPSTKNTCFIVVSPRVFNDLQQMARIQGYNIYALFVW